MLKNPTLFILGAGASVDYGFPTGEQLRRVLSGEKEIHPEWLDRNSASYAADLEEERQRVKRFQQYVKETALSPVDRVIERQMRNAEPLDDSITLWRRTVAQSILQAEQQHDWHWEHNQKSEVSLPDFIETGETRPREPWFRSLFSLLERGVDGPDSIRENPFWIWSFNYDRLIERLFFRAFRSCFSLSDEEAFQHVRRLPIRHIHGDVGQLSLQPPDNDSQVVTRFGGVTQAEIKIAARRIKPAHEPLPQGAASEWWAPVLKYGGRLRIVFLGFGFDPDNVKKLELKQVVDHGNPEMMATWWDGPGNVPAKVRSVMRELEIQHSDRDQVFGRISGLLDSIA